MHTLNQGLLQYLAGSALRFVAAEGQWEGDEEVKQLKVAFLEFRAWTKQHKIPNLVFLWPETFPGGI